MQGNPRRPSGCDERGVQRVILALVVESYPVARTRRELSREIGERAAVVRAALKELERVGLVEMHGRFGEAVRPTVAARACHRLEAW
jgi:DNA-binding FadR family transcriptional regulator